MQDLRQKHWDEFLARWPIECLEKMTLEEYANSDASACFSGWIKYRYDDLGKARGRGGWYVGIGVFAMPEGFDISTYPGRLADEEARYAWSKDLGDTLEEAFQRLKSLVGSIAWGARRGDLSALSDPVLEERYKWKLASLYQDPRNPLLLPAQDARLLPVMHWRFTKRTLDKTIRNGFAQVLAANANLMLLRGGKPLFEFLDEVQTKFDAPDEEGEVEQDRAIEPENEEEIEKATAMDLPLNTVLFGPPGTGKTFAAIDEALRILDPALLAQNEECLEDSPAQQRARRARLKARFDELSLAGRVRFVTFHQSFSYEDFVEGIRAETNGDGSLSYPIVDGVFKELCDRASVKSIGSTSDRSSAPISLAGRRIWKMSLGAAIGDEAYVFEDCKQQGVALLGYGYGLDFSGCKTRAEVADILRSNGQGTDHKDYATTAVSNFVCKMKVGDLIVVTDGNLKFRAIGEVKGDYQFIDREDEYCQARPVQWHLVFQPSLAYGELMNNRFSQMTLYELRSGSIDLTKLEGLLAANTQGSESQALPYVLIIDEINRGNVSRIFGELITLIEPSKRAGRSEALSVSLPYSKQPPFSVPANVFLLGTMNTADRSLTGLDIALRRRFVFKEMMPRPELLSQVVVSGINIGELLSVMNQRIEVLLDRDHLLGHAYFMPLLEGTQNQFELLGRIFKSQVLPLLQEYFFEDWERISWVLNDHRKPESVRFVRLAGGSLAELFGEGQTEKLRERRWALHQAAFDNPESYRGILTAGL